MSAGSGGGEGGGGGGSGSSLDDDVKKYAFGVEFKAKLIGKRLNIVYHFVCLCFSGFFLFSFLSLKFFVP